MVRDAVGDDCAIAVRIGVDLTPGLEVDEALEFIRLADHLVDLWDVNVGSIAEWSLDSGASRFFGEGYQLEWTGRVREATAKPIVGVGRFTNPDRMAEVIRSGVWDLIGAARPSIADPFLPRKIEEGRYGESASASAATSASRSRRPGHHLGCTQNATAGEEYRRGWHPERFEQAANADRDVLVVGAGAGRAWSARSSSASAGCDACTSSTRSPRSAGSCAGFPACPGLGEWARVVNWRRIQLEKLKNVEVVTGAAAGRSRRARVRRRDRRRGDGRALVGERPERPPRTSRCRAPTRLAAPRAHPGAGHGRGQAAARASGVAVYDGEGYFMASGIAEQLASEGRARGAPDAARADRACLRRDSRGPVAARAAPRRRRRACTAA